jgi:hypothetical protein
MTLSAWAVSTLSDPVLSKEIVDQSDHYAMKRGSFLLWHSWVLHCNASGSSAAVAPVAVVVAVVAVVAVELVA